MYYTRQFYFVILSFKVYEHFNEFLDFVVKYYIRYNRLESSLQICFLLITRSVHIVKHVNI